MAQKCLGIIGGMGPAATIAFMATILQHTPATRATDHLHLIVDSNPKVPDINAAALGQGPSAAADLQAMARRLESAGADFLVMACNAGHIYEADIRAAVSIPFLSMPAQTTQYIAQTHPQVTAAAILATDGGLKSGVYQRALQALGITPILPSEKQLDRAMDAIRRIQAGVRDASVKAPLIDVMDQFKEMGADCVISACTEIPLVVHEGDTRILSVDPALILAQAAIRFAQDA